MLPDIKPLQNSNNIMRKNLPDQSDEQAEAARQSSDQLSEQAHGLKDLISRFIRRNTWNTGEITCRGEKIIN